MTRAMVQVSLLFTQRNPNAVRSLSNMYSNYLKIMRKLQEQTINDLVTACPKCSSWNPNVFIPLTNTVYVQISFLKVYVLGFS